MKYNEEEMCMILFDLIIAFCYYYYSSLRSSHFCYCMWLNFVSNLFLKLLN